MNLKLLQLLKWKLVLTIELSISELQLNRPSLNCLQEYVNFSESSVLNKILSKSTLLSWSEVLQREDQTFLVSVTSTEKLALPNLLNFINKCVLWEISNVYLKLVQSSELKIHSLIDICVNSSDWISRWPLKSITSNY
jgi:hypothetical protein